MEAAVLAGVLAAAFSAADTVPYVRDTVRGSTVPHRGTWLVWSVLGVIAVESQRADGARWSLVPLVMQAAATLLVLVLSIRLGVGGLNRTDTTLIAVAGIGVVGWATVHEPVVATTCVIAADLVAALMMLPKTWRDPHSETQATFVLAAVSGALAVASVGSGSVRLLAYPAYFMLVNVALALVIAHRRRVHPFVTGTPATGDGTVAAWRVESGAGWARPQVPSPATPATRACDALSSASSAPGPRSGPSP